MKDGKSKKTGSPAGDEMTRTVIPSSVKPRKKVNYTHKEGK